MISEIRSVRLHAFRKPITLFKILVVLVFACVVLHLVTMSCDRRDDQVFNALLDLHRNRTFAETNPFVARVLSRTIDAEVPEITSALWTEGCNGAEAAKLKNCSSPRKKVVFVKVHKCASSTSAAVILRFAVKHQLKIAAPKYDLGHVGWPSPFRSQAIWGYPRISEFDVLAHHTVYDRCHVMEQFPKGQTVYLTILREPFAQFKSSVSFFNELNFILPKNKHRYLKFLESPKKYEQQLRFSFYKVYFGHKSVTRNFMATDLGFPYKMADNKTAVDIFIKRTHQDFDLVMISEYLPESLVLMKRLMCWHLQDILHLKLNENKKFPSPTSRAVTPVSDTLLSRHREHSAVDYRLYEHFNKTLWEKIALEGPDFVDEVKLFKSILSDVADLCLRSKTELEVPKSRFSPRFIVDARDCDKLRLMPESYTADIWNKNAKLLSQRSY